MKHIVIITALALVVGLGAFLLSRTRSHSSAPGLTLGGGTHFAIQFDSSAPGATALMQGLTPPDFRRAEREAQSAVRQSPKSAAARYNLGLVFQLQGHVEEAIREYRVALGLDPSHSLAAAAVAQLEAGAQ